MFKQHTGTFQSSSRRSRKDWSNKSTLNTSKLLQPRPFQSAIAQRHSDRNIPQHNTEPTASAEVVESESPSRTGFDFGKKQISSGGDAPSNPPALPIQAKLTLGQPNDRFEQEADRVATQVVQHINSAQSVQRVGEFHRQPTIQLPEPERNRPMLLQRRSPIPVGPVSNDFETNLNQARGNGRSLAPDIRTKMESAMGADFSGVRIHTGNQSDQLNRSISAKAFTTGQDVFFKQGEYQPGSRSGQELIAHELTHVVQQSGDTAKQHSPVQTTREMPIQRKAVEGISQFQTSRGRVFYDLGNGLFGSNEPINAYDVNELVKVIHEAPGKTNIQILTGTHGDDEGNLTGDPVFYEQDLKHEGHKHEDGGWVNVLDVKKHSKDCIEGWMKPGSNRAVILAWCYSRDTVRHWPLVNAKWGPNEPWAWSEADRGVSQKWAISAIQNLMNDRLADAKVSGDYEDKREQNKDKSVQQLAKKIRKANPTTSLWMPVLYELYLEKTNQLKYPLPYPLPEALQESKKNGEEFIQNWVKGQGGHLTE